MQTDDWKNLFAQGESPYFGMFAAGCRGIPIEEVLAHLTSIDMPLREKDIRSWQDGNWKYRMRTATSVLNPILKDNKTVRLESRLLKLNEFKQWPDGWAGTDRRWFPATEENMPMQRWGYKEGMVPDLHTIEQARALSPVGYVGQNIYAQPFIVLDIDGVGHGVADEETIEFGERFKKHTLCYEYWRKPGSFHLYFRTDRVINTAHWPYAKIDLCGNAKNQAVYLKKKQSNGLPMQELTQDIWEEITAYVNHRKEKRDDALRNDHGR